MKQPIIPLLILLCAVPHYARPMPPPLPGTANNVVTEEQQLLDIIENDATQRDARDMRALGYAKDNKAAFNKNTIDAAINANLTKTALYLLEKMPTYKGTGENFTIATRSGNIVLFTALFDRIKKENRAAVSSTLLNTLLTIYTPPLQTDILKKQMQIFTMLLDAGADANEKTVGGTTLELARQHRAAAVGQAAKEWDVLVKRLEELAKK